MQPNNAITAEKIIAEQEKVKQIVGEIVHYALQRALSTTDDYLKDRVSDFILLQVIGSLSNTLIHTEVLRQLMK